MIKIFQAIVHRGPVWLWLAAMLLGGLAVPQNAFAAPAVQDRDVQLLLQNDEDVAQVKQQLAAKEITRVDYTKRIQELSRARTEILGRYDRTGQRELVALYKAAVRDRQAAAAEAKRKAVAEARAEAAAKREATHQAALQESAAKVEAAKLAEANQVKEVQNDSEEAVKLMLREQELAFRKQMKVITPAEDQESEQLSAARDLIASKYVSGKPLANQFPTFRVQTNQLFTTQLPNARARWITDAFPEPDRILADFTDDTQRAAALIALNRFLRDTVQAALPGSVNERTFGYNLPAYTDEKVARYQKAADRLDPPSGPNHSVIAPASDALAHSPQFRAELAQKYLPVYAGAITQQAARDYQAARTNVQWEKAKSGIVVIGLIVMALPFLLLLWGQREKEPVSTSDANNPFQMPPALRFVHVFRKKYYVDYECGRIYDIQVWTETTTTTTTTTQQSPTGQVGPSTTKTSTSSVTYHRYWIRTPDGRETWRKFADDIFPSAKGQVLSTIDKGKNVLVAYNHTTRRFVGSSGWLRDANRFPCRWLWLLSVGIGVAGMYALKSYVGEDFEGAEIVHWSGAIFRGGLMVAVAAGIYLLIFKLIVQTIRNIQFSRKYAPKFEQFMKDQTTQLTEGLPMESVTQA